MNTFINDSVVPFLKRYWWLWLLLLIVTGIVLWIGAAKIGSFFTGLLSLLWVGLLLVTLYTHTVGRHIIGIWGIFRGGGAIILVGCMAGAYFNTEGEFYSGLFNLSKPELTTAQRYVVAMGITILFIGVGELLLYLHKINYKLRLLKQEVTKAQTQKEMLCPICAGKGFMDTQDIYRLQMGENVRMDSCSYCKATGYVDRGKPITEDVLQFVQMIPSIQEFENELLALESADTQNEKNEWF